MPVPTATPFSHRSYHRLRVCLYAIRTSPSSWSANPTPAIKVQGSMGTFLLLSKSSATFCLHASEVALLVFSAVVVIGLIGENKCRWPHPKEDLFVALVIIGVAGELLGDGGMVVFTGQLQTISDAEVKAATITAGDAQDSSRKAADAAKLANSFALEAEQHAAKANEKADRFRLQIAQANDRAGANEKDAALLKQQNLVLQDEVLKLRLRVADRRLTPEQQSRIAKSLCVFGGIGVDIGKYSPDGEIEELAKEIKGALPSTCDGKPGFQVSLLVGIRTPGLSGIQVIVKKGTSQKSKHFADALVVALKQEGLQVDGPMPDPTRVNQRLGGADFSRSIGAGIEPGIPVEIAIGRKP
jgi:hypothetical protein